MRTQHALFRADVVSVRIIEGMLLDISRASLVKSSVREREERRDTDVMAAIRDANELESGKNSCHSPIFC